MGVPARATLFPADCTDLRKSAIICGRLYHKRISLTNAFSGLHVNNHCLNVDDNCFIVNDDCFHADKNCLYVSMHCFVADDDCLCVDVHFLPYNS